jgi:hypothetical protein
MLVSFSARGRGRGLARAQALAHLIRDRTHVAGPEGQDQVTRPDGAEELVHHFRPVTHVSDIAAATRPDPLGQAPGMDPGDRRLARRIDVGHDAVRKSS